MAFDNDKRRETARVVFLDYLNKIENKCKRLDELDDWGQKLKLADEIVADLPNMVENFSDVLSKSTRDQLKRFSDFQEIYKKESTKASTKLIQQLEVVINELESNPSSSDYRIQNIKQTSSSSKSGLNFGFSPKKLITVIGIVAVAVGSTVFVNINSDEQSSFEVGLETPQSTSSPLDNKVSDNTNDSLDSSTTDNTNESIVDDTREYLPPILISPKNGETVYDDTPTFSWNEVDDESGIKYYTIEAYDAKGSSIFTRDIKTSTFDGFSFIDGSYIWQVRAVYDSGKSTEFSKSFSITIKKDIKSPPTPVLISPKNGETVYDDTPTFSWNEVDDESGIKYYTIEAYENGVLQLRVKSISSLYQSEKILDDGTYTWQVRAVDSKNNAGEFSKPNFFTVKISDRG